MKKQAKKPDSRAVSFPSKKQLEQMRLKEVRELREKRDRQLETLYGGIDCLMEVMSELVEAERITGYKGLPERVYIAFSSALGNAMHLARTEADLREKTSEGGRNDE